VVDRPAWGKCPVRAVLRSDSTEAEMLYLPTLRPNLSTPYIVAYKLHLVDRTRLRHAHSAGTAITTSR
jgi:hypothetical protein